MPSRLFNDVAVAMLSSTDMELFEALSDEQRGRLWKEYYAELDEEERESMVWSIVFYEKFGTASKTLREREKFEDWLKRKDLLNSRLYGETLRMAFAARYGEE